MRAMRRQNEARLASALKKQHGWTGAGIFGLQDKSAVRVWGHVVVWACEFCPHACGIVRKAQHERKAIKALRVRTPPIVRRSFGRQVRVQADCRTEHDCMCVGEGATGVRLRNEARLLARTEKQRGARGAGSSDMQDKGAPAHLAFVA